MVSMSEIEKYGQKVEALVKKIQGRLEKVAKKGSMHGIDTFTYMKYYRKDGKWCDESMRWEQ